MNPPESWRMIGSNCYRKILEIMIKCCPDDIMIISLTVEELWCWQTDIQTDTSESNTTLAVRMIILCRRTHRLKCNTKHNILSLHTQGRSWGCVARDTCAWSCQWLVVVDRRPSGRCGAVGGWIWGHRLSGLSPHLSTKNAVKTQPITTNIQNWFNSQC